jgi:lipid II:glycine glycyltransferase (peptidoglycan interpeptide bridge formation enzyme)
MDVRLASEADRDAWNEFVAASPYGNFRQVYEWGELQRLVGWQPVRLLIEESGRIGGVIQMLGHHMPVSGLQLFYAPRGPVLSPDAGPESALRLMQCGAEEARRRAGILLRVDPEPGIHALAAGALAEGRFKRLPAKWSYWNCYTYSLRLHLGVSEERLLGSFRKSKRYDIRAAERAGLVVTDSCDPCDMWALHALWKDAGQRRGFPVRERWYYEALWKHLVERRLGQLLIARDAQGPVAAGFFAVVGNRAWYLYGAADPSKRQLHPTECLLWGAMRRFLASGFAWVDLMPCAAAEPHDPSDTLFQFKMGFRPEVIVFPGYFDRPLRPTLYRLWQVVERHGLPLADRVMGAMRSSRTSRRGGEGKCEQPALSLRSESSADNREGVV